jgi:ceramide glucosyltransferase
MTGLAALGTLALVLAVVLVAGHLASVVLYWARLAVPAQLPAMLGRPHVTLIRPVCGADPLDPLTLRTSFLQDYPDYEVIFCAARADDPAVPLVRALMAANPAVPARLLVGDDRITGNPKLDNVWKGWRAAQGDWVCLADSNLLLSPDYLATLVDSWGPATGAVSAPPVGIAPEGWAARLECAFLNGNQARLQYFADSLGPAYAQGKTLFFNKPLLQQAGGLHALGRRLAEDVATTRAIRSLGREVTLAHLPWAQPVGRRSLRAVWARQLRWSRVRREGFPVLFVGEVLNGPIAPLALAAVGGASPVALLAGLALWYGAEAALTWRAGWPAGWRDLAMMPLRDLMLPALWLATFARRGFEWRGNAMGPVRAPAQGAVPGAAVAAAGPHPVPAE